MSRPKRVLAAVFTSALLVGVVSSPALASDHVFNAANSEGADNRGFANPVAANPSGTSGAQAQPGTVPGEGNPNAGQDTTTPAVDLSSSGIAAVVTGIPRGDSFFSHRRNRPLWAGVPYRGSGLFLLSPGPNAPAPPSRTLP